jgi:cyclopropane-fatty-acyl-phospholipid synthase
MGPGGPSVREVPLATSTRSRRRHQLAPTTASPAPGPEPSETPGSRTAAQAVHPLVTALLGPEPPVRVELWDGSAIGPDDPIGTLKVRTPDALRRILWAPGELGLARAHVSGDLDVDGDMVSMLTELSRVAPRDQHIGLRGSLRSLRAAVQVGALGRPLPPPPEESRQRGRLHSKARDAAAISHHYDVGNEFYDIVLGPAMTYSCAYFDREQASLAEAQAAKHELVCRKLGLHERPGVRLLDVGCGWGSMAMHAASHHDATAVGITISQEQAQRARERVEAAGLSDRVEIRLQDYRDLGGEQFDAISSIGMFEHVGSRQMEAYFTTLHELLGPGGRLLNHAISSVGGSRLRGRSFTGRYVFPDGELLDVSEVVAAMEGAGFEVRDVHSLREHYAQTLRCWVANLERDYERAVELVGEARARVWRLYMAASAVGFEDGGVSIHQVLGVVPSSTGESSMARTRDGWATTGSG